LFLLFLGLAFHGAGRSTGPRRVLNPAEHGG